MNLITISRQFGSGGRELGKRMADLLGWDYYDRELITRIAKEQGLDLDFVDRVLEQNSWRAMPITVRNSFSVPSYPNLGTSLLLREKQVIEGIAAAGRNCILVGRNADVYLRQYRPCALFVCASMEARLRRCRDRAGAEEHFTDRELERRIRRIDRGRAATREFVGGDPWGDPACYQLTVNTTDWEIKALAPVIAEFTERWFAENRGEV